MGKIFEQDEDEARGQGVKKCLNCGKTMRYGILDHIANKIDCEHYFFIKKNDKESSNPEKAAKKDLMKETEAKSETEPEDHNADMLIKLSENNQKAPKDIPSLGPETDAESESYMNEEEIYELISEEIESDSTKKGLWTKAYSDSEGDESKTKALYIKYRFDQIKQAQPQVDQETIVKDDEEKVAEEKVSNEYKIKLSDRVIKEEKSLGHYHDSVQSTKKSLEHNDSGQSPEKFGGFLLFLAFILPLFVILEPFLTLLGLGTMSGAIYRYENLRETFLDHQLAVGIAQICFTLIYIYLLFQFYKKKSNFPILYKWFLSFQILINLILSWQLHKMFAQSSPYEASDLFFNTFSKPHIIVGYICQICFILYFHFSTRVKKTFTQ